MNPPCSDPGALTGGDADVDTLTFTLIEFPLNNNYFMYCHKRRADYRSFWCSLRGSAVMFSIVNQFNKYLQLAERYRHIVTE